MRRIAILRSLTLPARPRVRENFSRHFILLVVALIGQRCYGYQSAEAEADAVQPPLVGQPSNFSGAVGSYTISMHAEPTRLQAEDPLTLTVRITGQGTLDKLARPDLQKLPKFARNFQIANLGERSLPEEHAREFDYCLRPRHARVKQIPALPFVFFKPGYLPEYKGYQTTQAAPIPLVVRTRLTVRPAEVQGEQPARSYPDSVYELATGPAVLRHAEPFTLPGAVALGALTLAPPLGCLIWLFIWRRLHPDVLRRLRRRQSWAGQEALRCLAGLAKLQDRDQVVRAEQIMTQYLRNRVGLCIAEPTPREIAACLRSLGVSLSQTEKVAEFFAVCAAARFAPDFAQPAQSCPALAGQLVHSLEDDTWPSQAA